MARDDVFKLSSGLTDDVDVTFRDPVFRVDPEYNNGQTLFLDVTLVEHGDDGGEHQERFGCGKGWETNDGGKTATREDGRETTFNKNSKIGRLIGSLVGVMDKDPNAAKAIQGRVKEVEDGPYAAAFWKGMQGHLMRETVKGGAEIGDYDVLVFSEIKAFEGGKATGTAKKASGAARKAAGGTKGGDDGGLTVKLRATLDDIADASADHDSFMEAAFAQVSEASSDDAVKAAITDDGEGSIWQDALDRYQATLDAEG